MPSLDVFVSVISAVQIDKTYDLGKIRRLCDVLAKHFTYHEIILIDRSPAPVMPKDLSPILAECKNIQYCSVSARVSRGVAVTAGLDRAIGDFVVVMDLNVDPPEDIPLMVELARNGTDIVYGIPSDRRNAASLYDRLARSFLDQLARFNDLQLPPAVSSMRVFSRSVLTYILASADCHRILALAPALSGYAYAVHNYDRAYAGRRRITLQTITESIELILTTSVRPLRLVSLLSLSFSVATVLYAIYVVLVRLLATDVERGWAALSLQLAVSFFVLSIVLAVMCEYLLQVLEATKRRPVYHISRELYSTVMDTDHGLNVETSQTNIITRPQASSTNIA